MSDQEVVKDEERSKYKMNSLNYKIKFNNDVVMSMLWNQNDYPRDNEYNSWVNYWGTFSPEKIQMIIEASDGGITEEELYPTAEFIALKTPNVPANPTYAKMQVYTSARRNAAWAANFNKLLANYQLEHGSRMIDEYNTKLSGKTVYMELGPDGAKVY